MSVLYMNFTNGKEIVRVLNNTRKELNDILSKLKSAESNLNGISKKSKYVDRCKAEIQAEKRRVQQEIQKIETFITRFSKFLEYARERDRALGRKISKEGYEYRKNSGLLSAEIIKDLEVAGGILLIGSSVISSCLFPSLIPIAIGTISGGAIGGLTGGTEGFFAGALGGAVSGGIMMGLGSFLGIGLVGSGSVGAMIGEESIFSGLANEVFVGAVSSAGGGLVEGGILGGSNGVVDGAYSGLLNGAALGLAFGGVTRLIGGGTGVSIPQYKGNINSIEESSIDIRNRVLKNIENSRLARDVSEYKKWASGISEGGSKATNYGKYSTIIDDKVKVIDKVNLPEWIAESFTDGNYRTVVTEENITFYRTFGSGAKADGSFVTTTPAGNRINAKINTALVPEWKNSRQYEAIIEVPKGTTINIGRVEKQYTKTGALLEGDGDQILLPQGWTSEWIKEIREVPSR